MDYTKEADKFIKRIIALNPHIRNDNINKISKGEMHLLMTLFDMGGISNAGELSKKIMISTARVAAILNLSEEKGYLIRNQVLDDRRKTQVVLTDKGRTMLENERKRALLHMVDYLKFLGEEDVLNLYRIMEKTEKFRKERNTCNEVHFE